MFVNPVPRIIDWWKKALERESECTALCNELSELMEVNSSLSLTVKKGNEQAYRALRKKYLAKGWSVDELEQIETSLRFPPMWQM